MKQSIFNVKDSSLIAFERSGANYFAGKQRRAKNKITTIINAKKTLIYCMKVMQIKFNKKLKNKKTYYLKCKRNNKNCKRNEFTILIVRIWYYNSNCKDITIFF